MILIVIPLKIELDELIAHLMESGYLPIQKKIKQFLYYEFNDLKICLAQGGLGKVQFALQSYVFLNHIQPHLFVAIGTAGSLSPNLKQGDILLAEIIIEHDFKQKIINKNKLKVFKTNPSLMNKLLLSTRKLHNAENYHVGILASGDEDIIEEEESRQLRLRTGADAVCWESAGGARAAQLGDLPFLEIRFITDSANQSTFLDFKKGLKAFGSTMGPLVLLLNQILENE